MKPRLRLWVCCQEVPGPGEGVRRGLVTCGKNSQRFIAQLLIAQSLAGFFVTCLKQQIQQIIMVRTAPASFREQAIHQPVHELHHRAKFTVACGRHPQGKGQGIAERVEGVLDTDL